MTQTPDDLQIGRAMMNDSAYTPEAKMDARFTRTNGAEFVYEGNQNGITVTAVFERPHNERGFDVSEVRISFNGEFLFRQSVVLNTYQGKTQLIEALREWKAEEFYNFNYLSYVEHAVGAVLDDHRRGDEPIKLSDVKIPDTPIFRLEPYLVAGSINTIYAPGSSTKSLTSLYWALLIDAGLPGPTGIPVKTGKVLVLDYEDDQFVYKRRIDGLMKGLNLTEQGHRPNIEYLRCKQPLPRDEDKITKLMAANNYDTLIIDSLGLSCGGLEDADIMNQYFRVLREIISNGATALLITHTNKADKLFGSIYVESNSRSVYKLEASKIQTGLMEVALFHTKQNHVAEQPPSAYRVDFTDGGIKYTQKSVSGTTLAGSMNVRDLALDLQKTSKDMSSSEVAEAVAEIKDMTVEDVAPTVEEILSKNPILEPFEQLKPGERYIE
tara:strand:- start:510 stop:1826 length:1317 start_codon:yes stop_codon:yes gene_type:complete